MRGMSGAVQDTVFTRAFYQILHRAVFAEGTARLKIYVGALLRRLDGLLLPSHVVAGVGEHPRDVGNRFARGTNECGMVRKSSADTREE